MFNKKSFLDMVTTNAFLNANKFDAPLTNVRTENGALSYSTIGTTLLNQFGKAGSARGRNIETVWAEQSELWAEDSEAALKFPFYLRMITRKTEIGNGEVTKSVQRGQGARDESFKRLLWIAKYHPQSFYANLWLLPMVGSWKDLWVLLTMDDSLNEKRFFSLMAEGINDPRTKELVKKYMPRIRANSKCKTEWAIKTNNLAKRFANFAGWSYEDYRTFKTSGKAHKFQTYMCQGLYSSIKWKEIPGKALLNLVSGKFLKNHGLEDSYIEWLKQQPTAKFNGYVYELGHSLDANPVKLMSLAQKVTIDKQFKNLIETAKDGDNGIKGNVLCAIDTSGSMGASISNGSNVTCMEVSMALGIYFSELNEGLFHNNVAMFNSESTLLELKGEFTDKWLQLMRKQGKAMGSTNFQSVVDLLVRTRIEHPEIKESEFPQTILCVSDMQFNPCGVYYYDTLTEWSDEHEKTNYETAMSKLRKVFSAEFVDGFKIVWWYVANNRGIADYPTNMENKGTYMLSGFDGSTINFILGGEEKVDEVTGEKVIPTMEEVVDKALHQEVLELVTNLG